MAGTPDPIIVTRTTESGKFHRIIPASTIPKWGTEWPKRSETLCWYCCHPFDSRPLPMPIRYDDRRDTFECYGVYCSFSCVKAYNRDCSKSITNRGTDSIAISLFKKRLIGKYERISTAPPRHFLQAFGGSMTIEEFRACGDKGVEFDTMPPKMITLSQVFHERRTGEAKRKLEAVHHNLSDPVNLGVAGGSQNVIVSENLKLKRAPKKKASTMLERTLGISM
jgi:hypothetical protein